MPPQSEHLIIRIEGPAFDDYYPAERVAQLVITLEKLLRSSTEAILLRRNGSRPKLRVLAGFPTQGSYVQELLVVWDAAQHMANLAPAVIPLLPDVIQTIGDGIDLLKKLLPAFDSNEEPSLSVQKNNGSIVFNQNTITFNIGTLQTTEGIAEFATSIAQKLGDGINNVTIESPHGPKVTLDQKDRPSLGSPRGRRAAKRIASYTQRRKEALAEPAIERSERFEAVVDILSFDKVRRTGTLAVLQAEQLPSDRFDFELARSPDGESAIVGMLQPRVRVTCRQIGKRKLELLRVEAHLQ
jgi:hypothetical protein